MSYSSTSEKIYLTFSLKNCEQNTFYKILALVEDSQSKYKENLETEEKQCFQNNSLIIFFQKMVCNFFFERNQTVKIQIIKKRNNDKGIIDRMTVLSSLISSPNSIYERKINKEENSEILCIKLDKAQQNLNFYENNNSLFDYFKSGLKLSCFISLDFSNIKLSPSLIDTKSNYVKLLKNISIIFSNYTENHLFYTYGFGANFLSDKEIFNINLKKSDSKINTINEVLKYFKLCLKSKFIKGEKFINLSPLIKKITKEIYKLKETNHYNTAFIIIRGLIDQNDVTKTIDAIIESSLLPLTIFVIGVGKNDYSQMNNIFSSNNKLSSTGIEKKRNNAFFISLIKDFSNNTEKLISWCGEELSKQITNYYDSIKTTPKDVYGENFDNIKNSFNLYYSSINVSYLKNKNPYNPYNIKEENIDIYKNEENPCDKIINNNDDNNSILQKEPYNYINKKPIMYDISFGNDNSDSGSKNISKSNNNINSNTNSIINNNSKNKKVEEDGESMYTPNPVDELSIYPKISSNPYCGQNEIKEENKPEEQKLKRNNSPEKKYNIPASIVISNLDKNYNPYVEDKKNNINENLEQSNNYKNNNPYVDDTKKQISEDIEQSNNDDNYNYFNNYNYNPFFEDNKKQINKNYEQSINYNNNYNPYLEDNRQKMNQNNEQNNNIIEKRKINKISNASELNSTKNSENVKSSNFFLFNNYSIDKSNMK